MKSFALSLAFIMRLTATRKWPITLTVHNRPNQSELGAKQVTSAKRGKTSASSARLVLFLLLVV